MLSGLHFYGGKLKDMSFVSTQMLNTRVFRLFSASDASGIGVNGLIVTRTATALAFNGAVAFKIL